MRDTARAHILAAENPASEGRYILSNSYTLNTAAELKKVQKALPHIKVPQGEEGEVKQIVPEHLKASLRAV